MKILSIDDSIYSWIEHYSNKIDFAENIKRSSAKSARLKNQVKIVEVEQSKDFLPTVVKEARTIKKQDKKLIVVASDDFNIEASELGYYIDALNYTFVMDDVYLMAFHPEDDGEEVEFLEDNLETENDFLFA